MKELHRALITEILRFGKKELAIHKKNISNAAKAIGYHEVKTYDFPDNRFDSVALLDLVKAIEKEKNDFKPEIIFTHHGGDTNIDHRQTYDAVMTATRPMSHEVVKNHHHIRNTFFNGNGRHLIIRIILSLIFL